MELLSQRETLLSLRKKLQNAKLSKERDRKAT
jgi:hypothetical protein